MKVYGGVDVSCATKGKEKCRFPLSRYIIAVFQEGTLETRETSK
jgi:hypothetical protein